MLRLSLYNILHHNHGIEEEKNGHEINVLIIE